MDYYPVFLNLQGRRCVVVGGGAVAEGKAQALAVRLKEKIATLVGPQHARFLELAGSLRERLAQQTPSFAARRALWYQLVDSDVIELLKQGDEAGARARMEEIMGVAPDKG